MPFIFLILKSSSLLVMVLQPDKRYANRTVKCWCGMQTQDKLIWFILENNNKLFLSVSALLLFLVKLFLKSKFYAPNVLMWFTACHIGLLLTCLHDQNKSGFFGGPAFIKPIRAIWKFSKSSDWLKKSRPSKKAAFVLIM